METQELIGYYTLRNFLNDPLPVDDFNRIKFLEAELFLIVQPDGTVIGPITIPPEPGASEKKFMDIEGTVKNWSSPLSLEFAAKGRPNTGTADFLYRYLLLSYKNLGKRYQSTLMSGRYGTYKFRTIVRKVNLRRLGQRLVSWL